jgi:hypothetical protein
MPNVPVRPDVERLRQNPDQSLVQQGLLYLSLLEVIASERVSAETQDKFREMRDANWAEIGQWLFAAINQKETALGKRITPFQARPQIGSGEQSENEPQLPTSLEQPSPLYQKYQQKINNLKTVVNISLLQQLIRDILVAGRGENTPPEKRLLMAEFADLLTQAQAAYLPVLEARLTLGQHKEQLLENFFIKLHTDAEMNYISALQATELEATAQEKMAALFETKLKFGVGTFRSRELFIQEVETAVQKGYLSTKAAQDMIRRVNDL